MVAPFFWGVWFQETPPFFVDSSSATQLFGQYYILGLLLYLFFPLTWNKPLFHFLSTPFSLWPFFFFSFKYVLIC